jgi:hypothetical protein
MHANANLEAKIARARAECVSVRVSVGVLVCLFERAEECVAVWGWLVGWIKLYRTHTNPYLATQVVEKN